MRKLGCFLGCFLTLFILTGIFSEAGAQTPEQVELAKRFGIDIDDFKSTLEKRDTGIGQQIEDFTIKPPVKEEREDIRKYLGFREDLRRFGEEIFSDSRDEFKIADDAHVPDDYLIGLGDEIIVQYYGSENAEFFLEVDRSGSITLPSIGPIRLNGLKFSEARDLIRKRVQTQFVGLDATVSIGRTKFINVFLAGNVVSPGIYSMPALSRVTHALYMAGGISELGTFRNIQVKRRGKLIGSIDLYEFLVDGDNSSDINLRPNDVILVGVAEKNLQITGAVKRPGIFELKDNEDSQTLLKFAGGPAPGADLANVIYSSLTSENPTQTLNFNDMNEFDFHDGDAIFLKFKATTYSRVNSTGLAQLKSSAIRVSVQGEVNYPGTYLLQSGERISDLISRAGGPTEGAFLEGAVFTREAVRQREAFRARELAEQVRRQVVSTSQTQSTNLLDVDNVEFITEQLDNYAGIGRVIIDMPRALAGRGDANLVLADGDALFIPGQSNTITVFGEVRRQSSYVFNPGFEIEDYLTLAAGMTQLADEDNIYVVKANGNIVQPKGGWFSYGSSKVLDKGDTIIVPVDYSYRQSLPFWRDVVSIVYQGAVAIAAISGL